jgi:membrane fusion protein, multidrug efflux system
MRPAVPSVLLLLAACGPAPSPPAPPAARPVRIAPVGDSAASRPIVLAGALGARDEVTLSFKVGGVVHRVAADPGDRVRAGQVLATLDLREVDAQVARARAAAAKARRDLERLERLARDSVATAVQAQDARTALDVAEADLAAAEFNRSRAVIAAPAAGTVLRRTAEPGELVAPGAPVLSLASDARGQVFRASAPDRDRLRLAVGDSASVRLGALPGRVLAGVVLELGAAPDPRTGAYRVVVGVAGAARLPSGLVGTAELRPRAAGAAWVVPVEALVEADGRTGVVWVLRGGDSAGLVERREVRIAFVDGGRAGIAEGLAGARAVVTDGAPFLSAGDSVRVRP